MCECNGGVWHWYLDVRIAVIALVITTCIGVSVVVVNAMAEQLDDFAEGPFIITNKEVVDVTRNCLFFDFKIGTVYLLYNSEGQYASISEATYNYYSVGDLYPNAEPQIFLS